MRATLTAFSLIFLASSNAITDDQKPSELEILSVEEYRTAVKETVEEGLWAGFLSVADSSFTADNKQINLDFQDGIYRLKFDYGKKQWVKPGETQVTFTNMTLNGSVPVSRSGEKSKLPTLNELANGSTLELKLSWTWVPLNRESIDHNHRTWWISTRRHITDLIKSGGATRECLVRASYQILVPTGKIQIGESPTTADENKKNLWIQQAALNSLSEDEVYNLISNDAALIEHCEFKELIRSQALVSAPSAWNYAENKNGNDAWIKTLGINGKVGQETFSFLDSTTFQSSDITETTYSFGIFARYERGNADAGTAIDASIELQHAFKENEKSTECKDPNNIETCLEGIFGAPTADDTFVAKASLSKVLDNTVIAGTRNVAFTIGVNYDIENDIFSVDAPVFLYRDDNNLGAGFRAGWRSDTDEFETGFFVSQKFSL